MRWLPLSLAVLLGCPVPEFAYPPGPPRIERFEAAPFEIRAGDDVTLRWRVAGADEVTIRGATRLLSGLPTEGERTVTVTASTTFELTASDGDQRSIARASVAVRADRPLEILRFEVTPSLVEPGDPVRVVWRTENADRVVLRLSTGETILDRAPDAGTIVFRPEENLSVLLRAEGWPAAESAVRNVRVRPNGPVILRFYAEPPVAVPGQAAGLVWEVASTERLRLVEETATSTGVVLFEQDPAVSSGYLGVQTEAGTHTYRLEATNALGTLSEQTSLYVGREAPPEILSFTVTPTLAGVGGDLLARWSTRGAPFVSLLSGATELLGRADASGAFRIYSVGEGISTYDLVASARAQGETVRRSRTVVVSGGLPEIRFFTVSPHSASVGEPISVNWGVSRADQVRITTDYGVEVETTTVAQGALQWPAERDVALVLTATNDQGVTKAFRSVQAAPQVEIVQFGADVPAARLNRPVTFSWASTGADAVALSFTLPQGDLPVAGSVRQPAGPSAGIVKQAWLTARNDLFLDTATVGIQILPNASGQIEEEPNDDLPVAAGPYYTATVDGLLTGDDVDLYELVPSLGNRMVLETTPLLGCSAGIAMEIYEFDFDLGLLGPRVVLDTASICASASALDHPEIASLEPPVFVEIRRPTGTSSTTPRPYRLSFQTERDACGDGIVDLFEECDDGNVAPGDGCAADCREEQKDELEPNDTITEATTFVFGLPVRGFLAYEDVDFYRFTLPASEAGQKVLLLEAPDAGACDLDMELVLMDESGRVLARDDNGGLGCPQLAGPGAILGAGVYFVGVYRGDGVTLPRKGRYVFSIQ